MKKIICALMILVVIMTCIGAGASGGVQSRGIYVDVYVAKNPAFTAENITFSLYNSDAEKIGEQSFFLGADDTRYELYYDVDFVTGDKFLLELTMGGESFVAGNEIVPVYNYIPVETYAMLDGAGNVIIGNTFSVTLNPNSTKMDVYINGERNKNCFDVKNVSGVVFCEMHKLVEFLHLDKDSISVDGDNVTIKSEDKSATITVGDNRVLYSDGSEEIVGAWSWYAKGKTYLPVAPFAKYFADKYREVKSDYAFDIEIDPAINILAEKFVIQNGIDSKTNYLIWISKKDFRLHLFKGSKGNWKLEKSFPCTIGAPSTPTITGQYDYIEKLSRWTYPKYYVGPVMRFYNGYAIHTVLLKYDGTEYDGRVGHQLSLGCIRVKKDAMEYLVETVPMKTKIYITE